MKKIIILLVSLVFLTNLYAVDIPWNDKKLAGKEKKNEDGTVVKEPDNSLLTIDGVLWFGFEKTDSRPRGIIDNSTNAAGTSKDKPTGFTLNRGYVVIKGEVKEGDYKGWDYRVTLEANSAFENTFAKHAYFSAPIPGIKTTWLRFGQQHLPTTDGQAGSSMESLWGKRYLDLDGKAMWEELGMTGSTDLGVSLIHKADFYGLHLMLSNGEGHKSLNGQGIVNNNLNTMAAGQVNSHGLAVTGNFSLTPMKKDSEFGLHINFPFRFENVMGIHRKEYDNVGALDYEVKAGSTPQNGAYKIYKSEARAKQDRAYGVEVDGVYKAGSIKATLGIGHVIKIDQQNNAYMIDSRTRDYLKAADIKDYVANNITPSQDKKGMANYIFAVLSYGKVGLISRYSTGTGTNSMSDRMGTTGGMSVNNQMLYQDLKDDGMLNLSPEKAAYLVKNNAVDMGQSTFKKITLAVEYQVTPKFFVALGFRDIYATHYSSGSLKVNEYSDLSSTQYKTNNFADNTINTKQHLSNGLITDNDMIGVKDRDRQIFIRSSYAF